MSQSQTVMYLSYGEGLHAWEVRFSLLTAFRHQLPGEGVLEYVVYTDRPGLFSDLGVTLHQLSTQQLDAWVGKSDYHHRRKTAAILDALDRFPGKVAFVDSDTWFRRSPTKMFDRIGPSRTLFHAREGRLNQTRTWPDLRLAEALKNCPRVETGSGRVLQMNAASENWNTGVLGLDSADIELYKEALDAIDIVWNATRAPHTEQFVTGLLLGETRRSEALDLVFHYWPTYAKKDFSSRLPSICEGFAGLSVAQQAVAAYNNRLRPTQWQVAKHHMRRFARSSGIPVQGAIKSL